MVSKAAQSARERFLESFEKSYGKGSIKVSDKLDFKAISTGSIALDRAMSSGGFMFGRVSEVWGPPGGGKSSLCLGALANAQAIDKRDVVVVNVEHTYDPVWARTLGVDTDRVLVVDPLSAENVADMVKDAILSDAVSTVLIDSIGAVLTNKEFEKTAEESDMGKRAQVVSRMINIALGLAPRHDVALIVINQARANFGYGLDTKQSGGFVLNHSSTHRLNVKRASSAYTIGSDDNKVNIGFEMGVKVERSKVGPEGRNVKFDFYTVATDKFGPVGIDKNQEAFNLGVRDGLIEKAGAWFTLPDGERFQGKDPAIEHLRTHPKIVDEIRTKIVNAQVEKEFVMDTAPDLTEEQKEALVSK